MQKSINAVCKGYLFPFKTKMEQAATMLKEVYNHYRQPVLIATDSWFGNDGLWSRFERGAEGCFHLLSSMRTNLTLYDFATAPAKDAKRKAGRPRKYGGCLDSVDECASRWRARGRSFTAKKNRGVGIFSDRHVENDEVACGCCFGI